MNADYMERDPFPEHLPSSLPQSSCIFFGPLHLSSEEWQAEKTPLVHQSTIVYETRACNSQYICSLLMSLVYKLSSMLTCFQALSFYVQLQPTDSIYWSSINSTWSMYKCTLHIKYDTFIYRSLLFRGLYYMKQILIISRMKLQHPVRNHSCL